MAFDSRITKGFQIASDSALKHRRRKGAHFFFAGNLADIDELMRLYFLKKLPETPPALEDSEALVYHNGKLFHIAYNEEEGFVKNPEDLDNPVAIGSGQDYALAAMDAGYSALKAVEFAAKRDTQTGGIIRSVRLKDL